MSKINKEHLSQITKEDILYAIDLWDREDLPEKSLRIGNTKYYISYNGELYPSKKIFKIAYDKHFAVSSKMDNFTGGKEFIVKRLSSDDMGFHIINVSESNEISIGKEGKKFVYYVTRYERNLKNRSEAIRLHGTTCMICGFNFEEFYGKAGKDYIEVHHLKPLHTLNEEIEINPSTDLICVCSNCHSIIHRKDEGIFTPNEVKNMIKVKGKK